LKIGKFLNEMHGRIITTIDLSEYFDGHLNLDDLGVEIEY